MKFELLDQLTNRNHKHKMKSNIENLGFNMRLEREAFMELYEPNEGKDCNPYN